MPRDKLMGWGAAVVLVVSLGVIIWSVAGRRSGMGPLTKAYYTVDDGASTFVDSYDRQAPFDHDGREAVRAHVFSADGNKTRFVGYLEKTDPEVARKREEAIKRGEPPYSVEGGTMVKRPGDKRWFTAQDGQAYAEVMSISTPNGENVKLEEVYP